MDDEPPLWCVVSVPPNFSLTSSSEKDVCHSVGLYFCRPPDIVIFSGVDRCVVGDDGLPFVCDGDAKPLVNHWLPITHVHFVLIFTEIIYSCGEVTCFYVKKSFNRLCSYVRMQERLTIEILY